VYWIGINLRGLPKTLLITMVASGIILMQKELLRCVRFSLS